MTATGRNEPSLAAPHRPIATTTPRERFALELFDSLWTRYRQRVDYVQTYERVVTEAGATFVNDHIAFRTFGTQRPTVGIVTLGRVFEALGYRAAGNYLFTDKHLGSIHYQHPNPQFPKLFVSELKTWELGAEARQIIQRTLASHRPLLIEDELAELWTLDTQPESVRTRLLETLMRFFSELPWDPPEADDVRSLNIVSQFGAWVLVHGYDVNHFTALVNSHGVAALDDIEKTIDAMRAAGVPMKSEIEGARGSKLRQTATEAVLVDVAVRRGGAPATMPWTYAYFEIAERGLVTDPETGATGRFEGFLGPQATQLFEMTRVK